MKFRRQHSVGKYVVDFYCHQEKLVIELDGKNHFTPEGMWHDAIKDHFLQSKGLVVLRFENFLVQRNTSVVLHQIESKINGSKLE